MSEQTLIKVDNAKLEKNSLIPFWSFQKPVNHRCSVDVLKQFRKIHRKTLKLKFCFSKTLLKNNHSF